MNMLSYFLAALVVATAAVAENNQKPLHAGPAPTPAPSLAIDTTQTVTTTVTSTELGEFWCQFDIPTSTNDYCKSCAALSSTPTAGYAVTPTPCDAAARHVRSATALNPSEAAWLARRRVAVDLALPVYLVEAWGGRPEYDLARLMADPPRVGMAFSGGGFRAMLGDAGVLQAFDSVARGGVPGVAGLLDSTLYVSSLSGGAWLVGSWALNDYPSVPELLELWNLSSQEALLEQWMTPGTCFCAQCEVQSKFWSGAPVSFADAWHRMIARSVLGGLPGDATWSGLLTDSPTGKLILGRKPLPIALGTGRTNNDTYEVDSTVFEMTPFEFGSWDPTTIGAFVPMSKLGTVFEDGYNSSGVCIAGFDNAAFILGTSSLAIAPALISITKNLTDADSLIPNPFCGFGNGSQTDCTDPKFETLLVNDGGDDLQNIPLLPLLQPHRNLDVVLAVDMSADTGNNFDVSAGYDWPNTSTLAWTKWYAQTPAGRAQGLSFPRNVPDDAAALGSNTALVYTPTFFGCNSSDGTNPDVAPPLVVYFPNAPYTAWPNSTTFASGTWEWGTVAPNLVLNGVALASTGGVDTEQPWATCLACAVADRARERLGIDRSAGCAACFDAYCAETKQPIAGGQLDGAGFYDPAPIPNKVGPPPEEGDDTYCYFVLGELTLCKYPLPPACRAKWNQTCDDDGAEPDADDGGGIFCKSRALTNTKGLGSGEREGG